ncbi:MAG: glycolate oxidase subunit GlcE [Gammaproteobacteria bacterium]
MTADIAKAEGAIAEAVRQHYERGEHTVICGHGSKHFYGNNNGEGAQTLSTTALDGIIEYEPGELFVGVWAGTSICQVKRLLKQNRQMLAFDPPLFGGRGTIGGAVAAGLSGPGRFYYGGVRDAMLGVSMINGFGELLHFGGRVIKNVAGYDISRLNAGALGTLGMLTRVYLRTAPMPPVQTTRALPMAAKDAATYPHKLTRQSVALSASFYDGEVLYLRLPMAAAKAIGGEEVDNALWQSIRDHTHSFFAARKEDEPLWRLSVPYGTSRPPAKGKEVCQWRGELIWSLDNSQSAKQIREAARADGKGGSATLFVKGKLQNENTFDTPPPPILQLHKELKKAFDPRAVFNRGRMHPDY